MLLCSCFLFESICNLRKGLMTSREIVIFNMEKFGIMFRLNHIPFVYLFLPVENSSAKDVATAAFSVI